MDELNENYFQRNISELTDRFEQMVKDGTSLYYEVDDLEHLLEHYIIHHRFEMGEQVISLAKNIHPSNKQLCIKEAELLSLTNRHSEALSLLKSIEIFESSNPDFHIIRASILSHCGNYSDAIKSLSTALELTNDDQCNIYLNLAVEYQNLEDYQTAITYLKQALSLEPENEDAIYELAYCFELSKEYEDSISTFTKIIDKAPYNEHAWFNLGASYQAIGDFSKAATAFDYAIVIDENFHAAYFNKANVLVQLKRYEDAIELYKRALAFEILDTLIYFYIGDCYDSLEQHRMALTYFEKAIKKDEEMAEAWLAASSSLDMLGRELEALEYAKKAVDIDPDNGDYYYFLAGLYAKYDLPDDAINGYEKTIETGYLMEDVWVDYAQLCLSIKNNQLADDVIERGLEQHSDNKLLQVYQSVLHFRNDREDVGFEQLVELLVSDPQLLEEFILFYPKGMETEEIQYLIESLK
ncbi:MAG: hypothetical protein Salg2KO_13400 [Salibacteraceae bacterium]